MPVIIILFCDNSKSKIFVSPKILHINISYLYKQHLDICIYMKNVILKIINTVLFEYYILCKYYMLP